MKKIHLPLALVLLAMLGAAGALLVPSLGITDDSNGDLTRSVQVSAAAGILKYHARNETPYRDLRSGTQNLTSGSFLKTGNGPADIILPGDSVLSLAANTEVQLGMYDNGIRIAQFSGSAWHFVEPQEGATYAVRTPFYTATAVGTEYRTLNNYPIEGAVTIMWGTVKIIAVPIDPQTGEILPGGLSGFVPQGHKCIWPPDPNDAFQLRQGEHEIFHAGQAPRSGTAGPDDAWSSRNRTRGQIIRELNRRRAAGRMTPQDYRQKLGALLGISPDLIPGQPSVPLGGLWIGSMGNLTIKLCISGNLINDVHIVDMWSGEDKETHEMSGIWVNFSLTQGAHYVIEPGGRVDGSYTIGDPDSIWKGATVVLTGSIGGGTGRLSVMVYSETDIARYAGSFVYVDIHLVDPNGCNY